ncbi:MAG: glycosyltransferase involved in cell wall biosynthesis [Sediminicola sp.]
MNTLPLISIILPVYNGEEFLSQAIDSCLYQSIENWELIIVDDCSTDQSLDISKKYQNTDSRIKIIENEVNKKLPFTLNAGFFVAKGEYITWTSDDNVLKPNFLEILLDNLIKTKSDFVFSSYDIVDKVDTHIKKQQVGVVKELLFQNVIGPSFLGKASLFKNSNYNIDLFRIEDYAFWLSNLPFIKCQRIEENLYTYRVHGSSLTMEISASGGFKHDLIDRMFTNLQHKFNYDEITKQFLVLNHLNKEKASDYLFENNSILIRSIFDVHKAYFQFCMHTSFDAHIKHYEKLLDFLTFNKILILNIHILKAYGLNFQTLNWFLIYLIKRIKRLFV